MVTPPEVAICKECDLRMLCQAERTPGRHVADGLRLSRTRADNERRYGTDIGRIGPMLLAYRYDDRTYFIFELLECRRLPFASYRLVNHGCHSNSLVALRITHCNPFDDLTCAAYAASRRAPRI